MAQRRSRRDTATDAIFSKRNLDARELIYRVDRGPGFDILEFKHG